jgi:thioredoxin 1
VDKKMKDNRAGSVGNKPIEITEAGFSGTIQSNPLVLIDFWAPWCGPCQIIAPIIEDLARNYSDSVVIGKLNVDQNQKIAMKYNVMSIPTLILFKNGKVADRITGVVPRNVLESSIKRFL